jgi:hypothetical protein
MNNINKTIVYIKSFGANPLAQVLEIIIQNIITSHYTSFSCEVIKTDNPFPVNEKIIVLLADGVSASWKEMSENLNIDDLLSWNHPVIYFRFKRGIIKAGGDSVHPFGFLTEGTGVKKLIFECPDDFDFENDTGLIEIMKNWIHELWDK